MKLKKNIKRLIIALIVIIIIAVGIIVVPKLVHKKPVAKEPKVINTIEAYDYILKDNKNKNYQNLFKELSKILTADKVDEKAYASKLAEMFIVDFYSLADKSSKTDIGGVDIVHPNILSNFLDNAENTFYKYVESNIYNNRIQKLPKVDTVTAETPENTTYTYSNNTDDKAYSVKVSWTYTEEEFSDYQTSATLIFVHQDKKLYLVELQ